LLHIAWRHQALLSQSKRIQPPVSLHKIALLDADLPSA
jgi:hypothetical protein